MDAAVGTPTARRSVPVRADGSGSAWTGAAGRSEVSRRSVPAVPAPVGPPSGESDDDLLSAEANAGSADTSAAGGAVDVSGCALVIRPRAAGDAVIRRATAPVRPATRLPCRARKPPATPARSVSVEPVEPTPADADTEARPTEVLPGWAGLAARVTVAGCVQREADRSGATTGFAVTPVKPERTTGGCSGTARRIASALRSAVTGPGAESGALGTALPAPGADGFSATKPESAGTDRAVPAPAGDGELTGATADGRTAAVARATDRRSAAAMPPPLCWETAPALAARADVESPLPVEFPGGADPGPGRADPGLPDERAPTPAAGDPDDAVGAGRGGRNLRCSCELVIGPAAVTSSIRRTGMAVDTRPPAMVPGDRG